MHCSSLETKVSRPEWNCSIGKKKQEYSSCSTLDREGKYRRTKGMIQWMTTASLTGVQVLGHVLTTMSANAYSAKLGHDKFLS